MYDVNKNCKEFRARKYLKESNFYAFEKNI